MPPNSEIEKLERRWKENPKGTVFAPYAEVLRKHGDHLLARDVLRQGLELHPDHIPGNIVLGRCCLDLREDGPAEAAFTHVLDLDAENVIALKALADITERQGRLMEAVGWLSRLITVDPSNEEARDQLARVDSAREAAAAAMTAPLTHSGGQAPEPSRAEDLTEALDVKPRQAPPPPPSEVPTVEVAVGRIDEDAESQIDARFSLFDETPTPTRPMAFPALPSEPATTAESEETAQLEALEVLELESVPEPVLQVPPAPAEPAADLVIEPTSFGDVVSLEKETTTPIELRPSGVTEFQAPDDSLALLDLSPGRSEFQVPDASAELTLSSAGGTEYQTPSGADELLKAAERAVPEPVPELEPEPESEPLAEPEPVGPSEPQPRPYNQVITTGFAAISLMPTEELSTDLPEEPVEMVAPEEESVAVPVLEPELEPELEVGATSSELVYVAEAPETEAEPESSLVDMLAAAGTTAVGPVIEPAPEPVHEEKDLKLIFPDDAAEPEPPRHRRLTQEVQAEAEPVEPVSTEPAPVLTESMAELYLRQGHVAEALNVYRVLAERQPGDLRLQEKVRALQASQAAGNRRLSYVAVDTGGESVESFFRSLAGARPAGPGMARAMVEDEQSEGAPTRPTTDPLSLSAIFGDESNTSHTAAAVGEAPAKSATPDAFSFDQFFGAASPGGAPGAPGGNRPPEGEDLDQFQNWLKSLKK